MILDYFCEDDDDACRRSFLCNDITGWKSSLKHERNKSGKGLKRIKMLSGMNYSVMIMWLNIGRGFKLARGVNLRKTTIILTKI